MKKLLVIFILSLFLNINAMGAEPTLATKKPVPEESINEPAIAKEYLAGIFAARNNDYDEAARLFLEASTKTPNDPFLIENTYKLTLLSGAYKQSVEYAEKYLEYDKNSVNALLLLAVNAVKEGDFHKASDILSRIRLNNIDKKTISIEQLLLPFIKMWVIAGEGNYDLALNTLDPHDSVSMVSAEFIILQKALLLNLSGDKEGAKQAFDSLKSTKGIAPYHLAKSMAGFYESIGQWGEAQDIYERYRLQHPSEPHFENAEARVKNKTTTGLYINNPKDGLTEVIKEAARLLFSSQVYNEGLVYVRLALMLKPDDEEANILLANFQEQHEDWQKASALYNKIKKDSDLYTSSQINKAENLYRAGQKKEAKNLLLDIVKNTKDKFIPLVTLADLYRKDNNFKEATKTYTKVLEIIDINIQSSWAIFFARGICYERTNDWKKAEKDFLKALELAPNQPEAANYLAYSWIERNEKLEQARDMLLKAVVRRPSDPQILDSAGWALYKMKDYNNAVVFLEKATEILPQDGVMNDHLGDIYWKLGRRYEARYQWQRAIKYGAAESSSVAELNRKIEKGLDK